MKKIFLTLIALTAAMSMNAQYIKLMKNGEVVASYSASEADGVEYEEQLTTGADTRKGRIVVKWVQLWEDGPKFAEYNVGAANNKAEDAGGSYCWGGSTDKDTGASKQGICSSLSGDDDTAIKLWGRNWRMPTKEELRGLLVNCSYDSAVLNGVLGVRYTGRGIYANNSIFLPLVKLDNAYYSSESDNNTKKPFCLGVSGITNADGTNCYSVRAVLTDGPIDNEFGDEDGNESYGGHGEDETGNWF